MRGIRHEGQETYLGDGLYVSLHEGVVMLRAPRPPGPDHLVFLDPCVLDALLTWIDCCMDRKETHGNA